MRAAVIDIGSNSLRYLDGEVSGQGLRQYRKLRETTRLAEGLDATGYLSAVGIRESLRVLAVFSRLAGEAGIPAYAYATSAVRDARDGESFAQRVLQEAGLPVEILTGEQEARYALLGTGSLAPALVDIGGGSFQVIGSQGAVSAPCGCVRGRDFLLAAGLAGAPLAQQQAGINAWMADHIPGALPQAQSLAGVGGSITTLAALCLGLKEYDPARLCGVPLTRERIHAALICLYQAGEARREHPLLQKRHDVILPGGMILLRLMELAGAERILPSDADGLEGYLMELGRRDKGAGPCPEC